MKDYLSGHAIVREQFGSNSFFAEVNLEATESLKRENTFEFKVNDAIEWKEAAIVGMRNGLHLLPSKFKHNKTFNISVTNLNWMPCDTTDIVVVYAATMAIFNMFSIDQLRGPFFAPPLGVFLFPK